MSGAASSVRAALRVPALFAWTASAAAALAAAWFPTLAARSGPARRARVRRAVHRAWGRGALAILGVRVERSGTPPPAGHLVVSNHLSYLDIIVLGSLLPVVFVSKSEVRNWPFVGLVATMAGTIYIDRSRKRDALRVLAKMQTALDRGDAVVIFPEATSTDGATILPFRSSLLAGAARAGTPVRWLTLSYRTPPGAPAARDRVCWWGDAGFTGHFLRLCGLPRIACTVHFGESAVRADDRKALGMRLRDAMMRKFQPVA